MKAVLFVVLGLALNAPAQDAITWFSLAAGGNSSSGGNLSVGATLGQADAFLSSSASYAVMGGFWAMAESVVSEGQPQLFITHEPPNIRIRWASPSSGFVLQSNSNVGNAAGWSAVGAVPSDNGLTKEVVLGVGGNPAFFRLSKP